MKWLTDTAVANTRKLKNIPGFCQQSQNFGQGGNKMENLPEWLTLANVLIAIGGIEALIVAVPNNWIPYRSLILRLFGAIEEF